MSDGVKVLAVVTHNTGRHRVFFKTGAQRRQERQRWCKIKVKEGNKESMTELIKLNEVQSFGRAMVNYTLREKFCQERFRWC